MSALPAFGIDIGSVMMKGVWLDKTGNGYKLKSHFKMQTPPRGMASLSPVDEEQMVQTIKTSVNEAKMGTRAVNIALPDNQVYVKVIETPSLNDVELKSAINWIAEQYIPAPLNTIMLDWQVLQRDIKTPTGMKMNVLIAGAPLALLSRYQKTIEFSGLSLMGVETEMLATIRAVLGKTTVPINMVISIGNLSSSIAIVNNGVISFIYTIPVGSSAINRAIASNFALSATQAEEYKRVYGIKDKAIGGKIRSAIEPILSSLIEEIKKGVAYYRERQQGNLTISQVTVSGGTAKMPGIDLYFVNALGLETVIANPWKSLGIENVPEDIQDEGAEFAVSIGLAMKEDE